jgi:hypothetical protein
MESPIFGLSFCTKTETARPNFLMNNSIHEKLNAKGMPDVSGRINLINIAANVERNAYASQGPQLPK